MPDLTRRDPELGEGTQGSAGGGFGSLAEAGAQVLLERNNLGAESLRQQVLQPRVARIALGVLLVGELARLDLA